MHGRRFSLYRRAVIPAEMWAAALCRRQRRRHRQGITIGNNVVIGGEPPSVPKIFR